MAELLGIGCTHAPMILNPAEQWPDVRKGISSRIPNYQAPSTLTEELGDDNGLSHDSSNQQRIVDAFDVLREKLDAFKPDLMIIVGDDQAENFLRDNLPTFCLYTGSELEGYPFHRPGGKINLWDAPQDTKYTFRAPEKFAQGMVNFLIYGGAAIAALSSGGLLHFLGWEWVNLVGLPLLAVALGATIWFALYRTDAAQSA